MFKHRWSSVEDEISKLEKRMKVNKLNCTVLEELNKGILNIHNNVQEGKDALSLYHSTQRMH